MVGDAPIKVAFGFTDQVVWIFGAGPRRSVPLHSTFNPRNPTDQKILNYSAIFDEVPSACR